MVIKNNLFQNPVLDSRPHGRASKARVWSLLLDQDEHHPVESMRLGQTLNLTPSCSTACSARASLYRQCRTKAKLPNRRCTGRPKASSDDGGNPETDFLAKQLTQAANRLRSTLDEEGFKEAFQERPSSIGPFGAQVRARTCM